ncbi:MAG TPA: GNAT family N-acetyltransferase [Dongiaceae bacterium]|nr:GNAT family N-acetyltransferase [Dongiaceae bacterium]
MADTLTLAAVADTEKREFLAMAEAYFRELNPDFVPSDDWREMYFARLQHSPDLYLRWICGGAQRMGFVIYGIERHRFLPRTTGCVYEMYILPQFRGSGVGKRAGGEVICILRRFGPSKIQLEIACGNASATLFWQTLGFRKVSERYVLDEVQK